MPEGVTRDSKLDVADKLCGRAEGRCQFDGCNLLLCRCRAFAA